MAGFENKILRQFQIGTESQRALRDETEPSLDARLDPEPKAAEDDEGHRDPADEEGGRWYVGDSC